MEIFYWVVFGVYSLFLLVAVSNLVLMVRLRSEPKRKASLVILIPARNEEENLKRLVPELVTQGAKVVVYDDASEDRTGEVAAAAGATVVSGKELPEGWTGKNHGCHQLFLAASEMVEADWYVFLDADVFPSSYFVELLSDGLARHGYRWQVITGITGQLSGKGLEPLYLGWVWWILLATNPFGLVGRTRMGHNRFLNGQFVCWHSRLYAELQPHSELRSVILEDVAIGRMLAKRKVPVLVMDVSGSLNVRMYPDLKSAFDGMSKNAFQIAGNSVGTVLLGVLLAVVALAWVPFANTHSVWVLLSLLIGGRLVTQLTVNNVNLWFLFHPISLLMASVTFFRSELWRKQGKIAWKGRTYFGS